MDIDLPRVSWLERFLHDMVYDVADWFKYDNRFRVFLYRRRNKWFPNVVKRTMMISMMLTEGIIDRNVQ